MSVQAGIWKFDGQPVEPALLDKLGNQAAEFGPDGETIYVDRNIGMLYRPFHTTAESRLERQPHAFGNGKIITWDGRLDNRDELISQIVAPLDTGSTDVAIVAAAFEQWGYDCFAKLVGDWALAVWDANDRKLILARDYIGIRHLFYHPRPKGITWCSHLGPLLCAGRVTLCDEYVAGYLASWPDAHLTPYQEIWAVPPGHVVFIAEGRTTVRAYWSFNPQSGTGCKTDADYEERYRYLFQQSVRRRLRTDSPVLADLSGGFDSSAIVCMADNISLRAKLATPPVDTFSFYDSSEPEDDDLEFFSIVEARRGKRGFHVDLSAAKITLCFEPTTFSAWPQSGHRAEAKAALSHFVDRHQYRVRLSGSAGDDVNGQALDPRIEMADLLLDLRLIELAKKLTAWSLLIRKRPWIHLLLQTSLQLAPVSFRAAFTRQGKVDPWICPRFRRKYKMSVRQMGGHEESMFLRPSARNALGTIRSLAREMSYLPPSSIEARYPYLDQNLVEFLKSVPLDQLLRPGERRSLMRRALRDLLPAEVLARKTKAGPGRCYCVAMQEHWGDVERVLSPSHGSRRGYFDDSELHKALTSLKNGDTSDYVMRLLRALSWEMWFRSAHSYGVMSPSHVKWAITGSCVPSGINET
jgi:asparagine synthase (glutamine-hydrolysing)